MRPGKNSSFTLSKHDIAILHALQGMGTMDRNSILQYCAGKAWTDLKKIPAPVTEAFERMKSAGFIKKLGKDSWVLTQEGETLVGTKKVSEATAGANVVKSIVPGTAVTVDLGKKNTTTGIVVDPSLAPDADKSLAKKANYRVVQLTSGIIKAFPITYLKPVTASASVAVAAAALLPMLSKWESKETSAGTRYIYAKSKAQSAGRFVIAQTRDGRAWTVFGGNAKDIFPKLAKTLPHDFVLVDGELATDKDGADKFKTPAEARKALIAALKTILIRSTNVDATAAVRPTHYYTVIQKMFFDVNIKKFLTGQSLASRLAKHADLFGGEIKHVDLKKTTVPNSYRLDIRANDGKTAGHENRFRFEINTDKEGRVIEVRDIDVRGFSDSEMKIGVAAVTKPAKTSKFDPSKAYSYYYRTVRLGFDKGLPQNRVDLWLCQKMEFDYDIAGKFERRSEEARADNKRTGAFGSGLSYGAQGRAIKLSSIKGSFRHSHSGIAGGGPLFVLHDASELKGAKLKQILSETVTRDTATASEVVAFKAPGAKPASTTDTIPDRAGNQIVGDIKRISSTIKAWKGKMDEESYAAFVKYQRGVAGFIAKNFLPKLSEGLQKKAKEIQ